MNEDKIEAYARESDPETSHDAAERAKHFAKCERLVVDAITEDGTTYKEVAEITGLALNTVSPRLKPLRLRGYITWQVASIDKKTGKIKLVRRNGQIIWYRTKKELKE